MISTEEAYLDSWKAISKWLETQHGGLDTYSKFQQFALALAGSQPNEAAAANLLSLLASRFMENYDGMPLTQNVAENALGILKGHVDVISRNSTDGETLQALNAIARSDLSRIYV